jgi:hypothetical protein
MAVFQGHTLQHTFEKHHGKASRSASEAGESIANKGELAILRQGMDLWNKWRDDNPHIRVKISNLVFSEVGITSPKFGRKRMMYK